MALSEESGRSQRPPARSPRRGWLVGLALVVVALAVVVIGSVDFVGQSVDVATTPPLPSPSATPTGPEPTESRSGPPTRTTGPVPSGTPSPTPPESDLDAFVRACEGDGSDTGVAPWRPGQVDYPRVLLAHLNRATTYNAAVDIRDDPLPAPTVIDNPGGDSRSEPVFVQCFLGARLVPVGTGVLVDPVGEWQYQSFTPTGVVDWSWTVTPTTATDHQVRLELRPAVKEGDAPVLGVAHVETFTTTVKLDLSGVERVSYWFTTQWPLLLGIFGALGLAVTSVLAWWGKLPLPSRTRAPDRAAAPSTDAADRSPGATRVPATRPTKGSKANQGNKAPQGGKSTKGAKASKGGGRRTKDPDSQP